MPLKGKLGASLIAITSVFGPVGALYPLEAQAQEQAARSFDIPPGDLTRALQAFAEQSDRNVLFTPDMVAGKTSPGAQGQMTERQALEVLLAGTGLRFEQTASNGYAVQDPASPTRLGAADAASSADEEIVVTGTRVRGQGDRFAPVQTYDRNELDRAGQTSARDFLAALPQNFGGGVSPTNIGPGSGAGPGTVAVNLRGLGNEATLTLLNGRRLARGGASGTIVDVSSIPFGAIDRIDVLTDGASAIYGTDAVGGVINFVLRRDYEGAETRLQYGNVTTGGGDDYQVAQTLGASDDRSFALMSYQYSNSNSLLLRDKDESLPASNNSELLPDSEQHAVILSAGVDFSSRFRVSADALIANRETEQTFTAFVDPLRDQATVSQYSVAATLEYDIDSNWRFSLTPSYARTDYSNTERNLVDASGFNDESLNEVSTLEGVLDGTLFSTTAGDTQLVIGAQYREETFESLSTSALGDVLDDTANGRDVTAVFAEVFVPVIGEDNRTPFVDELSLSFAFRYEDYSDAGTAGNPKVGVAYVPVEGLRFRASYGTSLRAPDLFRQTDKISFSQLVYYTDPTAPSGYATALYVAGNRSDLRPEEAESWSYGFDFEPDWIPGFGLRLTGYDISYAGRIDFPQNGVVFDPSLLPFGFGFADFTGPIVANPALSTLQDFVDRSPFFFNGTTSNLSDATLLLDSRFLNTAATETSGVDLQVNQSLPLWGGTAALTLAANYIMEFDQRFSEGGATVSLYDRAFQPVDMRARLGASWQRDGLTISGFANYTDDFADVAVGETVPSWTTVDASLIYEFDNQGPLRGTVIGLAGTNVFDEAPPRVTSATAGLGPSGRPTFFDSTNHDPTGRRIVIQLTKRW